MLGVGVLLSCHPSLRWGMFWPRFSFGVSLQFAGFIFTSVLNNFQVPTIETYLYWMIMPPTCSTARKAQATSNQTKKSIPHRQRVFQVTFLNSLVGCHLPLTKKLLTSGHSTINTLSLDYCKMVMHLKGSRISKEQQCSSNRVTIEFFVTSLTKASLQMFTLIALQL